jgi:hypothetical protein
MANLTKADLGKRGNDEVILKKFFHMDNHMNIFAVKRKMGSPKEGQFIPTVMVFVVDGEQTVAYEPDQASDFKEARARLQENMSLRGSKNTVLFTGKFQNDNSIATVPLTDLEKTEEFGGQVGGKKVNLGIQFEKDFYDSLVCQVGCVNDNTKYHQAAENLIEEINKKYSIKGGLSQVDAVGGKNQPRPLNYSGGLYVTAGGKKTKDIGSTVTDITTVFGGIRDMYLSLKYGSTLTFINSGVGRIFTTSDYMNYFKNYNNPIGNAIFDMFAIDKIEYANVFNEYGKGYKGKKVDVTGSADKSAIEDLLQYAIGYGYWMVHGKGGSSNVDIYEMTQDYMKKASKITGKITLNYGGSSGRGKRLDIHLESSVYKFMFNLRNKQGGKYPSHIMCDYKKK